MYMYIPTIISFYNYLIVIENEIPSPPPQVLIPNTGIDNSVNFTAPTITSEMVCH